MILPPKNCRRGVSFIEILMACAMLTVALVPIAGLLSGTARQSAATKAEASAAAVTATLMNTFLDKIDFDDPALAPGTHSSEANTDPKIPGSATPIEIDGTLVRWTLEVADILSDDVNFQHWRVAFFDMPGCPPAQGQPPQDLPDNLPDDYRTEITDRSIYNLDSKAGRAADGQTAISVLKELRLTVQWRSPRDPEFEPMSDDDRALQRTAILMTRRARLSRVAP